MGAFAIDALPYPNDSDGRTGARELGERSGAAVQRARRAPLHRARVGARVQGARRRLLRHGASLERRVRPLPLALRLRLRGPSDGLHARMDRQHGPVLERQGEPRRSRRSRHRAAMRSALPCDGEGNARADGVPLLSRRSQRRCGRADRVEVGLPQDGPRRRRPREDLRRRTRARAHRRGRPPVWRRRREDHPRSQRSSGSCGRDDRLRGRGHQLRDVADLWSPEPGVELLVATGRAKKTGFVRRALDIAGRQVSLRVVVPPPRLHGAPWRSPTSRRAARSSGGRRAGAAPASTAQ